MPRDPARASGVGVAPSFLLSMKGKRPSTALKIDEKPMRLTLLRAQTLTLNGSRGDRIMRVVSIKLALQAAILALVFSSPVRAGDSYVPASLGGDTPAKAEYCKYCHGSSGQGSHQFYTAPRLAGQTPQYFENQFRAILAHRRDNPTAQMFMLPALGTLDQATMKSVARYFSRLNPEPLGGGPKDLAAAGQKIYEEGVPEANVPACSACHGPDAKGQDANPRLAGQLYPYIIAQLTGWKHGYRSQDSAEAGTPNLMVQIAGGLSKTQITAVAAYLSNKR
jgi:cytochrome c553